MVKEFPQYLTVGLEELAFPHNIFKGLFEYRNIIVICILVFSGVALFLLVAQPAQKKKKALMQQQLGGFFRTELTKAFGPEPEPVTLPIDWAYLKAAKLSTVSFTECTVTDFHEGGAQGLRFVRGQRGAAPHCGGKIRPRQRQLDDPNWRRCSAASWSAARTFATRRWTSPE